METVTIVESREQTIRRLAAKARREGVQVLQDNRGRWWASSVSQPGQLHAVTAVSCDCAGFVHHSHCKHHSALLVHLGWVAGEPEPVCSQCAGTGTIAHRHSRWIGGAKLGYRSVWRVLETCEACTPVNTTANRMRQEASLRLLEGGIT
jgi:hypothetical protein